LERFGTRSVAANELKDEDWVRAVGAALRELGRLGSFHGPCVLGLPGNLTFNRLIHLPPVSVRQRRRILRFEEGQSLPATLEEMVWSHAAVSAGVDGDEVVLAAAKVPMINALGAQLRMAGFFPVGAVPAIAMVRQALCLTHPEPAEVRVLSIGARSTQFYLRGTSRCFVRTLAAGGNMVTQKIAEELGTDFSHAEGVKLKVLGTDTEIQASDSERMAVQIAVEQFVRRICGEIARSPGARSPEEGLSSPRNLLLAGGASRLRGLPALLAEKLHVPVEHWEPWSRVDLGRALSDLPGGPGGTQAADLVGLAAWAVNREPARINLLPRTVRREIFFCRRWPWLAGLVLIAVLGLLFAASRYRNSSRAAWAQAGEADAEIADFRRLEARNRANLGRLTETNRQISTLQRLAAVRSSWAGFLGDLQERLAVTEDVWLERLQLLPVAQTSVASNSFPADGRSEGARVGEAAGPRAKTAEIRLHLAGRVFDAANPAERNGVGSQQRAKLLLAKLLESPFVAGIEDEHFDGSQAGVLRFEITVALVPNTLF
jgi:Tfp pilus assembly PilM family ATPase